MSFCPSLGRPAGWAAVKRRKRSLRQGAAARRGRAPGRLPRPQADQVRAAALSGRAGPGRPGAAASRVAPTGHAGRGAVGRRLLQRPRAVVLLLLLACGGVLWLYGLSSFIRMIPLAVTDPASRTDAIVVLTGGKDRVATGLRLLADNKAERVFVSGVHPGVDAARLISVTADAEAAETGEGSSNAGENRTSGARAELLSRIDTGERARNTAGNAAESAAWLKHRGYSSLRLVTASYHIPRSLLEFRAALPGVRIVPHPVFSQPIEPGRWWRQPAMALLLIKEYNKLLLAGLRLRLRGLTGLALL
jgi:uncharacterized SAM-binding protein YcdF (DUF218 family)